MRFSLHQSRSALTALLLLPLLVGTPGCAVIYQLMHGDGHKIEAKYPGLKGQHVAVVCMMDPSDWGDLSVSTMLAERVEQILRSEVDDISMVRQDQVADWMDTNSWDETDFIEIGRGVSADMVVGIDIERYSTHESTTMLKGRADVVVTVYDIAAGGKEVFRTREHNFAFPKEHAVLVLDKDPRDFERVFIERLAMELAKNFYDYDFAEDFAADGAAYAH